MVAVSTAQMTRSTISINVFQYSLKKFILLMMDKNASLLHTVGKMMNGFIWVASDVLLKAVNNIHKKGTSIMTDPIVRMM